MNCQFGRLSIAVPRQGRALFSPARARRATTNSNCVTEAHARWSGALVDEGGREDAPDEARSAVRGERGVRALRVATALDSLVAIRGLGSVVTCQRGVAQNMAARRHITIAEPRRISLGEFRRKTPLVNREILTKTPLFYDIFHTRTTPCGVRLGRLALAGSVVSAPTSSKRAGNAIACTSLRPGIASPLHRPTR